MTESTKDVPAPGQQASAWQMLAPVIDLITPMAVRTAATLRLADEMGEGPVAVSELAQRSRTDPDALGRLLAHLVCHGIFVETAPGVYGLNVLADLLRSDHPGGMQVSLDLDGFGGQMDLAFTGLLHTIRTGEPAWESVFGAPFWQHLSIDPAMGASFDATMTAGAEFVADDVSAHNWCGAEHIVDVGGGTGALLAEILQQHPSMRATLVDLPETVERGRAHLSAAGVAERCEFVGQSFFDALPEGGDLYVLNSVLHDWADEDAVRILSRCAEAAGPSGRIIVIEESGIEDADKASFAEMDLRMLVLCGGRERSLDEYTSLAAEAQLSVVETSSTPLGQIVIECAAAP